MELQCILCHNVVRNPVAVSDRGEVYHLRAICSYLAKQLIEKRDERNPDLMDMGRIPVEQIIQRDVRGRVTRYFPDRPEDCDSWTMNTTPQIQELALRLMRAFTESARPEGELHTLSKERMIEIRDTLLRGEDADDECWLKSLKGYFDGMGVGSWAVFTGCIAVGVILTTEVGKSLGFVSTKKDEAKKPPTLVVDPEKLQTFVTTRV